MAIFDEAFGITLKNEGFYSKDPVDPGGETVYGISRPNWPTWSGWSIVDSYKKKPGFPDNMKNDSTLPGLVKQFYKEQFWNRFRGDEISVQFIANELFDTSVNMNVTRAVRFFQKALNKCNKNGLNYPFISEDGVFGYGTLSTFNTFLSKKLNPEILYKIMNILQGAHYIEEMDEHPDKEKYCFGWLARVNFIKN